LHLVLVSLWAGLALAETVLEIGANDDDARRTAAKLHYRLDLGLELPLLVGVLLTGGLLTARSWPLTSLLSIKVGAGLAAVSANLACVVAVVLRRRRIDDREALLLWTRRIRLTGLGVPFFLAAGVLGLVYFRA
jgi:hypothetical protein